MNHQPRALALTLTGLLLLNAGCDNDAARSWDAQTTPQVYVDNYPMQYLAQRIGGEAIDVHFPAPEGADPSDWMPNDDAIAGYQQADLVVLTGAGYAPWRDLVSLPGDTLVQTADAFSDRIIEVRDPVAHTHGDGEPHYHYSPASITWLDPQLAIEHARAIKQALSARMEHEAEAIAERFEALEQDLQELDAQFEQALADAPETVLASHDVYHYLEARFDVIFEPVHIDPTQSLDDEHLEALAEYRDELEASHLFWRAQPDEQAVQALEELGITSVVFATAEQRVQDQDWLQTMRDNAQAAAEAFGSEG